MERLERSTKGEVSNSKGRFQIISVFGGTKPLIIRVASSLDDTRVSPISIPMAGLPSASSGEARAKACQPCQGSSNIFSFRDLAGGIYCPGNA
ncbi:MAG: hypothetical protein QXH67_00145 [Candidatus Bathyarchaeia archaeon]